MVSQYKVFWAIPNAGPSLSTFHAQASSGLAAQSLADNVRAFFGSINSLIPNDVTLTFDTEVLQIDTATGVLSGVDAVVAPSPVTGAGAGSWAAGSGLRVVWATNGIVAGRRVRGSTFIVPAPGAAFDNDGTPTTTATTTLNNAAAALIAAGQADSAEMQVWSRPTTGRPGSVHNWQTGSTSQIAATLRGRKY